MRFVVLRRVRNLVTSELRWPRSAFAERIGITFDELASTASSTDPSIALVDLDLAQRLDTALGRTVSFECPTGAAVDRVEPRDIDIERVRAFLGQTGMSVATFAQIVGVQRETISSHLSKRVGWKRVARSAPVIDALLQSNEQPRYSAPEDIDVEFFANVMPTLQLRRHRCADSATTKPIEEAQKWRKILHVLTELSFRGAQSIDESTLIVSVWQAWPGDFGLRGYEGFYPESREIRAKLLSKPLCDYVERDDQRQQAWKPSRAGLALIETQRKSKKMRRLFIATTGEKCQRIVDGVRCSTRSRLEVERLPALAQIADALAIQRKAATPEPRAPEFPSFPAPRVATLAPFIANARR